MDADATAVYSISSARAHGQEGAGGASALLPHIFLKVQLQHTCRCLRSMGISAVFTSPRSSPV